MLQLIEDIIIGGFLYALLKIVEEYNEQGDKSDLSMRGEDKSNSIEGGSREEEGEESQESRNL